MKYSWKGCKIQLKKKKLLTYCLTEGAMVQIPVEADIISGSSCTSCVVCGLWAIIVSPMFHCLPS